MNASFSVLAVFLLLMGFSIAQKSPPKEIAPGLPVDGNQGIGWKAESVAGQIFIGYVRKSPPPALVGKEAMTADLVTLISVLKKQTPLPLAKIHFGELLLQKHIQRHLMDQFQENHQASLWNAIGGPDVRPTPGAPPLESVALETLRAVPDLKLIEEALDGAGYQIKGVEWKDFRVVADKLSIVFNGDVWIWVEPK